MMKKTILKKILPVLCAAMLAGCAARPAVTPASPISPIPPEASEGKLLELVNPVARQSEITLVAERPGISDDLIFPGSEDKAQSASAQVGGSREVRAVWISYLEMETLLKNKTEAQFTANISQVFDTVKNFGLNTVVIQVRPFGDALYNSEYFPWSYTITGTEGKNPGFDPLEIMVAQAKSRGLRVDAWVNPYRVRAANNNNAMSSSNQAGQWLNAGDSAVIRYKNAISYNPASEKAQKLIVNGIREIVRNYGVDAIHIDDYFYPSADAAFDSGSYSAYQQKGGSLSLGDWRRSNVESLLKAIYSGIKAENPDVLFGISPQGNMDINYNGQFLDVQKIVSNPGYCDYICPQVYYGFDNQNQPFATVIEKWNSMVAATEVDLYIGIAVYKLGNVDNYAGAGKNEWLNTTDQMKQMVDASRCLSEYGGVVLYRYDSLFRPSAAVSAQVQRERENLKRIL